MDLLVPSTGLLFWMAITFFVVLGIFCKFGLPVIIKMVNDRKAYIRLNVLVSDYLPQNASLRAIEAAGQKECRYCNMKITRESMMQENLLRQLSVDEIKTGSPVDIARLYYKGRFGTDMDSEMESMLEETVMEEMKKVEE